MAIKILVKSFIRNKNFFGYRVVELLGIDKNYLLCKFMDDKEYKILPSDIKILGILTEGYYYKDGVIYNQNNKPILNVILPKEYNSMAEFSPVII